MAVWLSMTQVNFIFYTRIINLPSVFILSMICFPIKYFNLQNFEFIIKLSITQLDRHI